MRQQLAGPIRRRMGVPFVKKIMLDELPASFRSIPFEYDGTTDSWDHICRFENTALLHRFTDGIKCRVFAITLTKASQIWFSQLGDGVIQDFEQFTSLFIHQFASSRKQQWGYSRSVLRVEHAREGVADVGYTATRRKGIQ